MFQVSPIKTPGDIQGQSLTFDAADLSFDFYAFMMPYPEQKYPELLLLVPLAPL